MTTVHDWNVVVTIREHAYKKAKALLKDLGVVGKTDYYNVLVMRVDDTKETLEVLRAWCEINPEILDWLGHFIPTPTTFTFQSPAEFETKAKEAVRQWLPQLAGKGFHVRIVRRGFRDRLHETQEERILGETILDSLEQAGTPAHVTFKDPDAIVIIETIGQQAGMSLWTREDMERYPFAHFAS